jgi:hypothetical protein
MKISRLVFYLRKGFVTKTDWLTDCQLQSDLDLELGIICIMSNDGMVANDELKIMLTETVFVHFKIS